MNNLLLKVIDFLFYEKPETQDCGCVVAVNRGKMFRDAYVTNTCKKHREMLTDD